MQQKEMEYNNEDTIIKTCKKFHSEKYSWKNIKNHERFKGMRKAAILIPLFIKDGEIYVWLTKRSSKLRNDPGDVAFPGGMKDDEDENEQVTCLREANEEIGLRPEQVKLVCQLLPRINRRLILITPVVGIIKKDFIPEINELEVETTFYLPLRRFLSAERHTGSEFSVRGLKGIIHFFTDTIEGNQFITWGLTATLCVEIAIALYQIEPQFQWTFDKDTTLENPYHSQQKYLTLFENDKDKDSSKL